MTIDIHEKIGKLPIIPKRVFFYLICIIVELITLKKGN